MKRAWLALRSALLWILSGLHFFTLCPLLIVLGAVIDPRRNDWPQRALFRNVLRIAGVKFEARRAPGFDPRRTCLFISNHVNIFDAFVMYSAIPQFVRGLELESHFRVPAYGWMMRRFGNIPVYQNPTAKQTKQLYRRTKDALDDGVSLVVFPEGGRTLDGHLRPFKDGAFRMAVQFGYPVVPVAITGSFEFNRKGSWLLHPGKIVVYLLDPIETKGLTKADAQALRDRVHETISEKVENSLLESSRRVPAGKPS
ncbi:MAG TPA: lysophospholipid acyltransferase family protein [Patescibacteria group bacterium]|nr:lysophospholipid acyltransferase family protein [Patescibacteria group bacterium]